MIGRSLAPIAIALAGVAAVSCADPVHDAQVNALGAEAPDVAPGPTHRPGQPCLVCHGGLGPSKTELRFGGTVYQSQAERVPLVGGSVQLTDATGAGGTATTNAAGNFLVSAADWSPTFPVRVAVSFQGTSAEMGTHVGRDGSCASCHSDPETTKSHGHVYLVLEPADFPGATP